MKLRPKFSLRNRTLTKQVNQKNLLAEKKKMLRVTNTAVIKKIQPSRQASELSTKFKKKIQKTDGIEHKI